MSKATDDVLREEMSNDYDFGDQRGRKNPYAALATARPSRVIRTTADTVEGQRAEVEAILAAEQQAEDEQIAALADRYALLIQWSDAEHTYCVTLPEWAGDVDQPVARGATREEAAQHGRDVLLQLVARVEELGTPLPLPFLYAAAD